MQVISGAYTSPLLDTDELKMALLPRKVSGALEKRTPELESSRRSCYDKVKSFNKIHASRLSRMTHARFIACYGAPCCFVSFERWQMKV